jgi:DNA-binding IclR family transcriptional regulator
MPGDGERTPDRSEPGGRSVIGAAFELLELIRALEPVRLVDLAAASGIPRPTVYRLLAQLIDVGVVRREQKCYRLGGGLVRLGAAAVPESRLRVAARRPIAELAARTGAAVALTARHGTGALFVDAIDGPYPLEVPLEPGTSVRVGTAMARVHGIGQQVPPTGPPKISVDAGEVIAGLNCVTAAVAVPGGDHAAITTFLHAVRPPQALLEATWATAQRIAARMRDGLVPPSTSAE